jgi:hypothetical protein
MPLASPKAAWKGSDLAQDSTWIQQFTSDDLAELDAALAGVRAGGLADEALTTADFPLPSFSAKLATILHDIREGRGFVVLRGLPIARYSDADVGTIFYGMGTYLGDTLRQNPRGDLLGHVHDQGRAYGGKDVRGYETNAFLPFHTDGCEIVGLLCLRAAKAGGRSSLSSALTVHAEIAAREPEALGPLYRGYHYIRREAALTDAPISPNRVPVFGEQDGVVSCRIVGNQIRAAAKHFAVPLPAEELRALDLFTELSGAEGIRLDMDLQVGDIQLCNNYTVLHSRTEYEDFPEPERKRHMLRLWLAMREPWPLAPGFPRQLGYGINQPTELHLGDEATRLTSLALR